MKWFYTQHEENMTIWSMQSPEKLKMANMLLTLSTNANMQWGFLYVDQVNDMRAWALHGLRSFFIHFNWKCFMPLMGNLCDSHKRKSHKMRKKSSEHATTTVHYSRRVHLGSSLKSCQKILAFSCSLQWEPKTTLTLKGKRKKKTKDKSKTKAIQ